MNTTESVTIKLTPDEARDFAGMALQTLAKTQWQPWHAQDIARMGMQAAVADTVFIGEYDTDAVASIAEHGKNFSEVARELSAKLAQAVNDIEQR